MATATQPAKAKAARPPMPPEPAAVSAETAQPGTRTTKVMEVENDATAAAGPHRPAPAKQRFHNPGTVPVDQDVAAKARKGSTYRLKVRATQDGYIYEARRRAGDVFVITDAKHFSKTWMEPVDGQVPEHTTGPNKAIGKANEETKANQYAERTGQALPATGAADPLGDD